MNTFQHSERRKEIKILNLPINPKSHFSDPDSSNQNPDKIRLPGYLADNLQHGEFSSPPESI
jgi:hypothetical protein